MRKVTRGENGGGVFSAFEEHHSVYKPACLDATEYRLLDAAMRQLG